jgi:hypothetical protein
MRFQLSSGLPSRRNFVIASSFIVAIACASFMSSLLRAAEPEPNVFTKFVAEQAGIQETDLQGVLAKLRERHGAEIKKFASDCDELAIRLNRRRDEFVQRQAAVARGKKADIDKTAQETANRIVQNRLDLVESPQVAAAVQELQRCIELQRAMVKALTVNPSRGDKPATAAADPAAEDRAGTTREAKTDTTATKDEKDAEETNEAVFASLETRVQRIEKFGPEVADTLKAVVVRLEDRKGPVDESGRARELREPLVAAVSKHYPRKLAEFQQSLPLYRYMLTHTATHEGTRLRESLKAVNKAYLDARELIRKAETARAAGDEKDIAMTEEALATRLLSLAKELDHCETELLLCRARALEAYACCEMCDCSLLIENQIINARMKPNRGDSDTLDMVMALEQSDIVIKQLRTSRESAKDLAATAYEEEGNRK